MKLNELIGLSITEIKYTYTYQNEYDLQEFFAYLKLSNGIVMGIPQYFDLEIKEDPELNEIFGNAKKLVIDCSQKIENKKIIDIHFGFYENSLDEEQKAYLELENGIYISERNYGPIGLTNIDLEILTAAEFEKLKEELEEGFEIKSYSKELINVC
jgi:hypothetical protein